MRLWFRVVGSVALLGATGCGASPAATAATTPATSPARTAPSPTAAPLIRALHFPDHVLVVVFENKDITQVDGSAKAPYLNALMRDSAVLTGAHAVAHPSQPNYLALFSGSTQGLTSDRCFRPLTNQPNLGRQFIDAGRTFVGYSENLPRAGYPGCVSRGYAAKHNPWVHFADLPVTTNQPYSAFPSDYAGLPTLAFVVPNLCHDMHDCSVSTGDAWAKQHLDGYVRWAATHNSLLVVTFDENDGRPGNHILTLFAGAGVTPGRYPEPVDHYSILRTIEELYGLPPLGRAGTAAPVADIWQ